MQIRPVPPWPNTPEEAIAQQELLARRVVAQGEPLQVRWVAGIDVSVHEEQARAAVAVLRYPELTVETWTVSTAPVTFPYIPGLLAYRELPVILNALECLHAEPDVFLCDAQGIAHPRRLGLASHLGVLLDRPTIGCAKSRLFGTPAGPLPERQGSHVPLLAPDGQVIGAAVRTRTGVQPVYVSVGHRVDLDWAIHFVLSCCKGTRLPEPTRQAHRLAAFPQEERPDLWTWSRAPET